MSKGGVVILALFAIVTVWGLLEPAVVFFGYTVFVTIAPRWTWRFSLPEWQFQNFLVGSLVVGVVLSGRSIFPANRISRLVLYSLFAYLLAVFVSYLLSENQDQSYRFLDPTWKICLIVALGMASIVSERSILWILWACVICQGWIAYEHNMTYLEGRIRVRGFYWAGLDSNTFSIMTLPIMAMAIAMAMYSEKVYAKVIALGVFVLQMHQMMFFQSRGTFMGGVLLALLAIWFMPKKQINILVAFLAISAGIVAAGPSVIEEFSSSFKAEGELDASAESRFKLWKAGTAIIQDYPILGVGPWMGQYYVPRYYEGRLDSGVKALHNLFFEVGTGTGLSGLIPFLAFYWVAWLGHLRVRKRWRESEQPPALMACNFACLCGIPSYWLASMFSSGALIESSYLLVMLGCCAFNVADQNEKMQAEELEVDGAEEPSETLEEAWLELEPHEKQVVGTALAKSQ